MSEVLRTMQEAGSRMLDAVAAFGKASVEFVAGTAKAVCGAALTFLKNGVSKTAHTACEKTGTFVKDHRQTVLLAAAAVSAVTAAVALLFFLLGRRK